MSAFVNPNQGGGYRYVYIHDYKFKTTPTAEEKEQYPHLVKTREKDKSGKVVEEIESTMLTGRLVEIGEREVPFDPFKENFVTLHNDESGEKFRISLRYMGRQILTIMQRLAGIREDLPIQLGVFAAPVPNRDDLKMALVYVRQQDPETGQWVKVENQYPYDKENPEKNIMPGFAKVKIKGKDEYDPTPQYEWLMENPTNEYLARLSKLAATAPAPAPAPKAHPAMSTPEKPAPAPKKAKQPEIPAGTPITSEYDDDLPF